MSIRISINGLLLLSLWMTGCASARVFDLTKLQTRLSADLQSREDMAQKAQASYYERKLLLENLEHAHVPGIEAATSELHRHLDAMSVSLQKISDFRHQMTSANSDIASLTYNRTQVRSDEAGYAKIEDAIKIFDEAAKALGKENLNYTREDQAFSAKIASAKLYSSFTPEDFHKHIQMSIKAAQDNAVEMQRELDRCGATMNSSASPTLREAQEGIYQEMQTLAEQYTARAQRYSALSREMTSATAGDTRTTNLDSSWGPVQNLKAESEQVSVELGGLYKKFQDAVLRFRNPHKAK